MPSASASPSTADLHEQAGSAATARVNVALPGTIVTYDHDLQMAAVQIVPCFRKRDDDGAPVKYRPPVVHGVPVAFYGGSGFSDTFPLSVGDPGILLFCDRQIDEWKATGARTTEPQTLRRHSLNDAIFIPGARSFADPVPAAGLDATARVIRAPELRLGSASASDYVALASQVQTALAALEAALDAASNAALLAATAGDGGTLAFTAFQSSLQTALAAWPPAMAATKVKAE